MTSLCLWQNNNWSNSLFFCFWGKPLSTIDSLKVKFSIEFRQQRIHTGLMLFRSSQNKLWWKGVFFLRHRKNYPLNTPEKISDGKDHYFTLYPLNNPFTKLEYSCLHSTEYTIPFKNAFDTASFLTEKGFDSNRIRFNFCFSPSFRSTRNRSA